MQLKTETKVGLFVLMAIGLFAYTALYLGVFRLHVIKYKYYNLYFEDLSGLAKKADVKIAGVKVGWIDNVQLIENGTQAKVLVSIKADYNIYNDAYAEIQQENLLGNKFLEILPGNPQSGIVLTGETIGCKVDSLVSVERLIKKFDKIGTNVQDISLSLKNILGSSEQEQLKGFISNINQATAKLSSFCDVLNKNEKNLDLIINNLQTFSQKLPPLCDGINNITMQIYTETLPSFQNNFQSIASRFDSTMEHCQSVAKKIDDGQGLLGKLVNGFGRKKKKKTIVTQAQ